MNLENVKLSEISHSQNGLILYDFTYMRYLVKFIDSESRMGGARRWGQGGVGT